MISERLSGETQHFQLEGVEFFGGQIGQKVFDLAIRPTLASESLASFGFAGIAVRGRVPPQRRSVP